MYELAVALDSIGMPKEPGAEADGQGVVLVVVLVAIVGTAAVAFRRRHDQWFAAIPLAAAAWMVAHYYAFDSYYLPTHRRFSDAGSVPAAWIYGVALVGVGVAVLSRRARASVPLYVLLCALTVVGMGVGH